jgi:hypothetical protein
MQTNSGTKPVPIHTLKAYKMRGGIAPLIFKLSIRHEMSLSLPGLILPGKFSVPAKQEIWWAPSVVCGFWRKDKYSRTSNNGHCQGIQILSVIGCVR